MTSIGEEAVNIQEEIVRWRRSLHRIPEVGLHCDQTACFIGRELERLGISWQGYEQHSGITALLGPVDRPVIGLRADMDGLPVEEENQVEYASHNGAMHACGHDAHTAILLGAGAILKKHEKELRTGVKLIFQPDEEGLTGAQRMIADGVLDQPVLKRIFALHVGSIAGQIGRGGTFFWKKGAVFASSNSFRISVQGRKGHASTPFLAVNPILAAGQIIENLAGLVSRESNYNVPSVLTFTGIKGGTGAYNIIPDKVEIIGGMRTQEMETCRFLMKRMQETAAQCAAAFGASARVEFVETCPPVVNDPGATEALVHAARKVLPQEDVQELKYSTMGGEDAAFYFTQVPGCYAFLYNAVPFRDGKLYPHHNGRFCLDDSVLYKGSAILAQVALDDRE